MTTAKVFYLETTAELNEMANRMSAYKIQSKCKVKSSLEKQFQSLNTNCC